MVNTVVDNLQEELAVREIVIVGASLAGTRTAQALRKAGYDGRLTLVGQEAHPPYDRPPLTKSALLHGATLVDLLSDPYLCCLRSSDLGFGVEHEHPHRAVGAHPGTSTRTATPAPGLDSIVSEPPRLSTRSRMPTKPNPLPEARPRPSSRTSRLTESFR